MEEAVRGSTPWFGCRSNGIAGKFMAHCKVAGLWKCIESSVLGLIHSLDDCDDSPYDDEVRNCDIVP